MAIPASRIVEIMPRVITAGSSNLEFNGLVLRCGTYSSLKQFVSVKAVGEEYGTESNEYIFAQTYFNGYANRTATPKRIMFAEGCLTTQSAKIKSNLLKKIDEFKADLPAVITKVELNIKYGTGSVQTVTVLLTALTTWQDLADAIKTAEPSVNAEIKSGNQIVITSIAKGATEKVILYSKTTPATDTYDLFQLFSADTSNPLIANGADADTDLMTKILAESQNWVTICSMVDDVAEQMKLAEWASNNWGYVALTWSDDERIASTQCPASSATPQTWDLPVLIGRQNYDNTAFTYGTAIYTAFVMGSIASIDWARRQGVMTLAFKKQAGLAATVTNETWEQNLLDRNANFFGQYATRNSEFEFYYNGKLVKSDYGFIDPLVNAIWLNNRLQVAIMDGLTITRRLPYNQSGYTQLRSWMLDPIEEGLYNGAIDVGLKLSEAQKSELIVEAGTDISEELYTQGYYIQILDPAANVRTERGTPDINLWYTYAGSIQRIVVVSTQIL